MIIVVPGAGVEENGSPSEEARKRLKEAKKLHKKYNAPLLLSGKYSSLRNKGDIPKKTEARSMYEHLLKEGVKKENMLLEENSQDTVMKAFYTKTKYFLPLKETEGVVITSDLYLQRTQYIFEKVFGESFKLHYMGIPTSLPCPVKGEIKKKQAGLTERVQESLHDIENGDHEEVLRKWQGSQR